MDTVEYTQRPDLPPSTLVAAFGGWNDAGQAASTAIRFLADAWGAAEFASIDPDEFYDFTTERPVVRFTETEQRAISWPANTFAYHAEAGRGFVLHVGSEPHLRWKTFLSTFLRVARESNCQRIVTIGGLVGDAVHTRPVPRFGYSMDPDLQPRIERLGLRASRYQGPTGIVGVLHDACRREGLPAASVWVAVPQYLGPTPNPKAALALLETLDELLDLRLDLRELRTVAAEFENSVTNAVAENAEIRELIAYLERQYDAAQAGEPPPDELPPPSAVIEDVEALLRERREGNGES